MLSTGAGEPSHLRALFGDVDLHTLLRLAALCGIGDKALARSYVVARDSVAAANAELDEIRCAVRPVTTTVSWKAVRGCADPLLAITVQKDISCGRIVLSDRPGMGYEPDSHALAKTRVK
jgi:hypothetical protein